MTLFPDSLREAALSLAIARQRYNDVLEHPHEDRIEQIMLLSVADEERLQASLKYHRLLEEYMAKARAA